MLIALTLFAHLQNKFARSKRRGEAAISTTDLYNWRRAATSFSDDEDDKRQKPYYNNKMSNISGGSSGGSNSTGDNTQIIKFNAGQKQCCQSIYSSNVKVIASAGKHDHGSSKVKLKNIVDYKWEEKHYPGHLIAVHRDGKYIAYAINVNNKAARMEGMVRVVNSSAGLRALIKGMSGEVLDLQFANIEKDHLLASIDLSSLYVHKIDLIDGTLIWNLMIKIEDPLINYNPRLDKITWCPFVLPDDDEDGEDESQLIVWTRGRIFQCFDVKTIVSEHGTGVIKPPDLKSGYIKFTEDSPITWLSLSPDGTTLAAAGSDGVVRFYQVYMFDDQNHRCLHQWKPHDGKPLSSMFFLDNINRNAVDSTYWKYAITGSDNNTEFKVWDCSLWECLQTITIDTGVKGEHHQRLPQFIAEIDRSANYLVITSLETRAAYILQILNNTQSYQASASKNSSKIFEGANVPTERFGSTQLSRDANGTMDKSDNSIISSVKLNDSNESLPVSICSIAEFPLSSGILSFSIVDASVRRLKCTNDNYLCEELDDYDDESNSYYSVVVHLFIVQSKSMQECHILYQPCVAENTDVRSSITISTNKASSDEECHRDIDILNANDIKKEAISPEPTSLNMIFAAAAASKPKNNRISTASSSTVIAVAAAAAAAPSAVAQESQSVSPHSAKKAYLMTPDAFMSTAATTTGNVNEQKTPENVSSDVLNTILMLASVTGQPTIPIKNESVNLINLVNNKLIEDQEHKKIQLKQNIDAQKKFIAIDSNPGRNAAAAVAENVASGGSSPSREVREIMSIQDEKFLDELSELIDELPVTPGNDTLVETIDTEPNTQISAGGSSVGNNSNSDWPKAPDVHKVQTKHSAELQNAANIMSQAVNANNSNNAPPAFSGSSSNSNNNLPNSIETTGPDVNDLTSKMNQLIDLVQMQSRQIHSLQCEIVEMKKVNPLASNKNFSEFSFKLEMQLSKLMEQYLKRFENEHKKKFSEFLQGREIQNREIRDIFLQVINQYVINQFSEVVAKIINIEIQRQLAPLVGSKLDHIQHKVQLDVSQKLATFDLMLKENIAQVCKSKHFIDAFGKSVLLGVQNSLQAAFIESMGSTLIPAYEKSSQLMFTQLHDAFTVGIKDFLIQFDGYLNDLKPMHDSSEQMINKFGALRQTLETTLAKHCNVVSEAMHDTQKEVKSLEILIARQVQETIRTELRKNFDNQNNALRSQTNTPAPVYDIKQTIKHLLHQGQINKAFHQALLANDLNLVEFALRNTDITSVFSPKCCLEQKVLLSLIQQLSADMSDHNEIKQNFLSEALLAINPDDPISREHAPKVLQDLYRSCQQFLKNYPKSPHCSNIRMTMKGVHSYITQF